MLIQRFFTPGLAIQSYLVYDEESRKGVVIDPTRQVETYISKAVEEKVEITDIFETHVHADFLSGAQDLKAALHNKPNIHCSGMGGSEWTPPYADHVILQDKESVNVGNMRFEAWHTPGHTPEHIIWLAFNKKRSTTVPEVAFTGDLLFVGSVGRPDLLGKEMLEELTKKLYRSLFDTLHRLPESVEIFPAHGSGSLCGNNIGARDCSTLGYERRCNPWLIPQEFSKWSQSLFKGIPTPPRYFSRMKKLNVSRMDFIASRSMPPMLTLEQIKKHPDCIVVDLRKPEQFAARHIKNSINIPWSKGFPLWAGVVLTDGKPIILVTDEMSTAGLTIQALRLISLDPVRGICNASEWEKGKENQFEQLPLIDVKSLCDKEKDYYILDVRTPAEWYEGHISSAHLLELTKMPEAINQVPKNKPVAVICHSGNRASLVASMLKNENIESFNVQGGMHAWKKAGLPVTSLS